MSCCRTTAHSTSTWTWPRSTMTSRLAVWQSTRRSMCPKSSGRSCGAHAASNNDVSNGRPLERSDGGTLSPIPIIYHQLLRAAGQQNASHLCFFIFDITVYCRVFVWGIGKVLYLGFTHIFSDLQAAFCLALFSFLYRYLSRLHEERSSVWRRRKICLVFYMTLYGKRAKGRSALYGLGEEKEKRKGQKSKSYEGLLMVANFL